MGPNTFVDQISHTIVQLALAVLVPVLVGLAIKALQKFGISLDADKQAQLEYVAKQAALKVEEVAAAQVANGLRRVSGSEKLEQATLSVLDKLPNVSVGEARDAIHAALPQIGAGATAGVSVLGKAMQTREAGQ